MNTCPFTTLDPLTEAAALVLNEDKLQNDILSLKKIGWKLDKVTKFLITKGDHYGIKMTSDLIASYYNPPKEKPAPKVKAPVYKKPSWPKDPPKSKINDPSHAVAYLNQAIESEESPDIYGYEAYYLLITAGYTEKTAMQVMRNMGWDADVEKSIQRQSNHNQNASKFAKKMAARKSS